MNLSEIKEALSKATHGEKWTNFDDREDSKTVYEYNRLTECTCDIIAECATVEIAEFIANAPEWIPLLVSQVEEMQQPQNVKNLLFNLHNERAKKEEIMRQRDALKAQVEEMQKTLEEIASYTNPTGEDAREMTSISRQTLQSLKGGNQ